MMTPLSPVQIGSWTLGSGLSPFALIAGPCAIEDRALAFDTAWGLKQIAEAVGVPLIFKSSFDKANRTDHRSFRGPGLEKGLAVLADIRAQVGIPVTTDLHLAEQAEAVGEVVDLIQVPAFLCRQTDLLKAAASTGKPVNVKKGQFLAPWDMQHVVEKLRAFGAAGVVLTERGASFGYNNLVSDMRSLPIMRGFGVPVCFDVTHSVQLPGGQGGTSGGQRQFAPVLARAAVAVGVDLIFMEVHPDPERALSDGPNMIPLAEVEGLLRQLVALDQIVKGGA